jgi:enoyl-CoA hydratase/carnithine racemase
MAESEDPKTYATLKVEESHEVISVTLEGRAGNRIGLETLEELAGLAIALKGRSDVGALVIRAEGADFSQGADLRDAGLASHVLGSDASRRRLASLGQLLIENWMSLPFPTVASCRGWVVGAGACLVAASGFRVASQDVVLRFPEVELGMSLSWGILPRLVREFSHPWTRRLVLAGEAVPVTSLPSGAFKICSADRLDDETFDLARSLAAKPRLAVRHTIETLTRLEAEGQQAASDDDVRFALTAGSDDFRDTILSFLGGGPKT